MQADTYDAHHDFYFDLLTISKKIHNYSFILILQDILWAIHVEIYGELDRKHIISILHTSTITCSYVVYEYTLILNNSY